MVGSEEDGGDCKRDLMEVVLPLIVRDTADERSHHALLFMRAQLQQHSFQSAAKFETQAGPGMTF